MFNLSVEEAVPGASVRVTADGMVYAIDLVMVVTGKNRNDAGKDLRNLAEETFPHAKIICRKTPGKGNGKTKLLAFQDAIELIMAGKQAQARVCRHH